jgi:hypothetical protein
MFSIKKSMSVALPLPKQHEGDANYYGTVLMLAACAGLLLAMFLTGCSGGPSHPVNPSIARESLKTALEQWKKGEGPRSLESSATPMTIQDFDWAAGSKLIDYQILDVGQAKDANLHVQVKLTLSDPKDKGKPAEKKVWYVVGTSPSVTVFRDALRR